MSIQIGHAVMDENGGIDGAIAGDQTGKEIATRSWYKRSGGWGVYLEPLDAAMGENAASYMRQICADSAFGYSQKHRWDGYKSIKANGGKISGASGDFDCSSLCISCYILAGLDHKASGYTGSMAKSLMATGKFRQYTDALHLESGDYAKRGGLYIASGKHVVMALTDGPRAGQAVSGPPQSESGDIATPYVLTLGNVRVRDFPITGKKLLTAPKDSRLPYIETDADTGWHIVKTRGGDGFITGKPRYTKLVP